MGRWTTQAIGVEATIVPGKERMVEHAIRVLSRDSVVRRTRFASTGWRPGSPPFFVHRGGVVGEAPGEFVVDILDTHGEDVFALAPVADERHAIVESLALLGLGDAELMAPLLLGTYRAALPDPVRHSTVIFGPSGFFKTAAALVFLSMPAPASVKPIFGSWNSTANYLEKVLYHHAGLPYVIDDMHPDGDRSRRLATQAQVYRAVGNQSGRGRMRSDTTLRGTFRPRAALISTGEDTPSPQTSMLARILALPVSTGSVSKPALTAAQATAREGLYCGAFYSWVEYRRAPTCVRPRRLRRRARGRPPTRAGNPRAFRRHRDGAACDGPTADRVAVDRRALTKAEGSQTLAVLVEANAVAIAAHEQLMRRSDPLEMMFEAILGGLVSKRCHMAAAENGGVPVGADAWGWQRNTYGDYDGAGVCIGYVEDARLYLLPKSTMSVRQRAIHGRRTGVPDLRADGRETVGGARTRDRRRRAPHRRSAA